MKLPRKKVKPSGRKANPDRPAATATAPPGLSASPGNAAAVAGAVRDALAPLLADLTAASVPLTVGREGAAKLLGIGTTLLDTQDAAGKLPAPVHIGTRKLYRTADLTRWTELGCPDRATFDAMTADPPGGKAKHKTAPFGKAHATGR